MLKFAIKQLIAYLTYHLVLKLHMDWQSFALFILEMY